VTLYTDSFSVVDELIDTELMCWSEDKLEENFIQTDRRAILQIPLGRFADDEWAWSREKNGIFSVRSAYRLISSIQRASQPSGSGEFHSVCWNKLWRDYKFCQKFGVFGGQS
jgi:hypothetical protein